MKFFKSNKTELTDDELLALFKKSGKSEYFGQLYNKYIPLVYGLCLKYLQDTDKAQDAVMEIFENLLSKIANYEIKVFKTWLYSVVKNHCYHLLKENKREIPLYYDSQLMESDPILTLLDENEESEEREIVLNKCLEKLPEPQKISVKKFFFEDMSYADIVEFTGYSLKSVKSYIQNGKRNLKICIENNLGK
ncbi:sigma-70 family RNA polymerase sigma factor [Dysgonomonas sp. 216]|uniref:RNA polymerase sigma factor n=1 Tax=Dysgonomonas sp. 216 TaxID=2302934 RepID=UPI0013CF624B|nr:sigma-70 family RNA polymerase sigma factor [Dysgonomonas sp. 216]NDW17799.1 sigma-70 family RNA polymerase sigma factor [Dysgonomonas sp. 216]